MSKFHLIDLVSQRHAVRGLLKGKSPAEVIEWLRTHGRVVKRGAAGCEIFDFFSPVGCEASFFFDGGEIVFLGGDHTTFR